VECARREGRRLPRRDQAAEKTAESEFLASVMEFEMLTAEEELRDLY